jgi:hypothetical protein
MFARNNRNSSTFSMIEGLEGRQLMSAVPLPQVGAVMPHIAITAPAKSTPGPKTLKGQQVIYFGSTSGINPQGQKVSDHLTLVLMHNNDGSWTGKVTIVSNQNQGVATTGKVTFSATGQITSYESSNGETITVIGQASTDWSTITGSYTAKNSQGTGTGTFSLAVSA